MICEALDGALAGAVDHGVGDGLRIDRGIEVGVDGDGQAAAKAEHRAGSDLDVAGQRLFDGGDGLVHLGIAEAGRKLHRAGLDHA